jgi:ATP-dependent helicase/nuclease subunit B
MPRRSAARRRWPRASCTGWRRSPASALEGGKRLRRKIRPLRRELDQPDAKVEPIPQPAPKPPRATRPLKLSVTAIEDWLRDPYTIYAKHILRLDPLDPVDMPLSAADRGSAIHDALGEFTNLSPTRCPPIPRRAARHRRKAFRAADGAARGAGAVVAALPAHRRMVCRIGKSRGAAMSMRDRRRDPGRDPIPLDNERIFAVGARRPHRAPPDGSLRDPRLQDRAAADRQAGAHGAVAAAHAGGRDPARGRL